MPFAWVSQAADELATSADTDDELVIIDDSSSTCSGVAVSDIRTSHKGQRGSNLHVDAAAFCVVRTQPLATATARPPLGSPCTFPAVSIDAVFSQFGLGTKASGMAHAAPIFEACYEPCIAQLFL